MPLALLVTGVLLLACLTPQLMQLGSALVTVANTFTLAVLWYISYDVAHNMHAPSYLVLGTVWVVHQVPREVGRLIAMGVGPYDSSPMLVAMCMIVLLAGSMFLLISNSTPLTRLLFADLERPDTTDGASATMAGIAIPATTVTAPSNVAPPSTDDIENEASAREQTLRPHAPRDDIARLLMRDFSKAQIGEALCLSESTVRTHARNLYAKLDVHSREQLKELVGRFTARRSN